MIKILSYLRNGQANKSSVFCWWFAWGALCAILLAFSVGVFAQTQPSYAFVTSYDPNSPDAYLKRHTTANLTTPAAGQTFAYSSLGAVSFSPDGNKVYVPDFFQNKIYVVEVDNPAVITETLDNPDAVTAAPIAVAASEDYVYVLNYGSDTVRRIVLASNTVDSSWQANLPTMHNGTPINFFPYALTLSGDGKKLYVANHFNYVFIVDIATPSNITTLNVKDLSGVPNDAEIWDIQWANTSGGKKLYVAGAANNKVYVFWEDGTYKTAIDMNRVPLSLGFSQSRNDRVYAGVICPSGTNNIAAIDTSTDTLLSGLNVPTKDLNASYVNMGVTKDADRVIAIDSTQGGGKMIAYDISADQLNLGEKTDRVAQNAMSPNGISYGGFLTPAPRALGDLRTVSVKVTLTGNTTLYPANTNFGFDLVCTGQGGASTTVPVNGDITYTGPWTGNSVVTVPEGASCTLSENPVFAIPGATVAPAFVNGKTRTIQDPTGNAGVNTFEVEYHIRAGAHTTAALTVEKKITGILSEHNSANEFEIDIACIDTSSAPSVNTTVKLYGDTSTTLTAFVDDECTISEPTLPVANAGYKYVASIVPSKITQITHDRTVTVTNAVVANTATTATLTVENFVTGEKIASGYTQGLNLFSGITLTCAGATPNQTFVMAEGEEATLSFQGTAWPANCTLTGVTSTTPALNAAYGVNPTGDSGLKNSGDVLTVTHDIYLRQQPAPAMIPTLDVRGLILLIGLMLGTMLWQSRRRYR